MTDYLATLQQAIRDLHGFESRHRVTVPVKETFGGETVWDGAVEVFELDDAPAALCYAWGHVDDEGGSRYVAVLGLPPIETAADAVRASIISEDEGI